MRNIVQSLLCTSLIVLAGCEEPSPDTNTAQWASEDARSRANIYTPYTLTSDLSHLSASQKKMVGLLIEAAEIMDGLYWQQAYGAREDLLKNISDPALRNFADLNYGPWDRLQGDAPFIAGVGAKSLGATFYPADMTKAEFENFDHTDKAGLYSIIRRKMDGSLTVIPYHKEYAAGLAEAAGLLREAAHYGEDADFKKYLTLRADALVTDNYQPSDFVWMDMKNNPVELVIGAIETYEDLLFGYRAAYEAYVLIKDQVWSEKLARYTAFLAELQRGLPVDDKYKAEIPGSDSDLNAYDVIYYAGHSKAGAKTIAINLPNDEEVQLKKGTRRLQLKNAMRAKFDKILLPIADVLIAEDQRAHVTFNAFFANTMFHEVAHGLGIKETLTAKGPVRTALKETASSLEEGKADILGLYMITTLFEKGELTEGSLMDYYVTFMAGIFRSSRFGASSAHGKANMVRFSYFQEHGAFSRDDKGFYRIDFDKFRAASAGLSQLLLTLQGDGDYAGATELLATRGVMGDALQADLARLAEANIPVDIYFNQGKHVLGLK